MAVKKRPRKKILPLDGASFLFLRRVLRVALLLMGKEA